MKIIKVEEFTPKPGEEYDASKFPHEGVFIGAAFNSPALFFVKSGVVNFVTGNYTIFVETAEVDAGKQPQFTQFGISEAGLIHVIGMLTGHKPDFKVQL